MINSNLHTGKIQDALVNCREILLDTDETPNDDTYNGESGDIDQMLSMSDSELAVFLDIEYEMNYRENTGTIKAPEEEAKAPLNRFYQKYYPAAYRALEVTVYG